MFVKLNKAPLSVLMAAVPFDQYKRLFNSSRTKAEARAAFIFELKEQRVIGFEVKGTNVTCVTLPKLSEALAETFGGRVVGDQVRVAIPSPTLKHVKLGVRKAMKKAGYRTQGQGLFPAKNHGETPIFYVERVLDKHASVMVAIELGGTPKRPVLELSIS